MNNSWCKIKKIQLRDYPTKRPIYTFSGVIKF